MMVCNRIMNFRERGILQQKVKSDCYNIATNVLEAETYRNSEHLNLFSDPSHVHLLGQAFTRTWVSSNPETQTLTEFVKLSAKPEYYDSVAELKTKIERNQAKQMERRPTLFQEKISALQQIWEQVYLRAELSSLKSLRVRIIENKIQNQINILFQKFLVQSYLEEKLQVELIEQLLSKPNTDNSKRKIDSEISHTIPSLKVDSLDFLRPPFPKNNWLDLAENIQSIIQEDLTKIENHFNKHWASFTSNLEMWRCKQNENLEQSIRRKIHIDKDKLDEMLTEASDKKELLLAVFQLNLFLSIKDRIRALIKPLVAMQLDELGRKSQKKHSDKKWLQTKLEQAHSQILNFFSELFSFESGFKLILQNSLKTILTKMTTQLYQTEFLIEDPRTLSESAISHLNQLICNVPPANLVDLDYFKLSFVSDFRKNELEVVYKDFFDSSRFIEPQFSSLDLGLEFFQKISRDLELYFASKTDLLPKCSVVRTLQRPLWIELLAFFKENFRMYFTSVFQDRYLTFENILSKEIELRISQGEQESEKRSEKLKIELFICELEDLFSQKVFQRLFQTLLSRYFLKNHQITESQPKLMCEPVMETTKVNLLNSWESQTLKSQSNEEILQFFCYPIESFKYFVKQHLKIKIVPLYLGDFLEKFKKYLKEILQQQLMILETWNSFSTNPQDFHPFISIPSPTSYTPSRILEICRSLLSSRDSFKKSILETLLFNPDSLVSLPTDFENESLVIQLDLENMRKQFKIKTSLNQYWMRSNLWTNISSKYGFLYSEFKAFLLSRIEYMDSGTFHKQFKHHEYFPTKIQTQLFGELVGCTSVCTECNRICELEQHPQSAPHSYSKLGHSIASLHRHNTPQSEANHCIYNFKSLKYTACPHQQIEDSSQRISQFWEARGKDYCHFLNMNYIPLKPKQRTKITFFYLEKPIYWDKENHFTISALDYLNEIKKVSNLSKNPQSELCVYIFQHPTRTKKKKRNRQNQERIVKGRVFQTLQHDSKNELNFGELFNAVFTKVYRKPGPKQRNNLHPNSPKLYNTVLTDLNEQDCKKKKFFVLIFWRFGLSMNFNKNRKIKSRTELIKNKFSKSPIDVRLCILSQPNMKSKSQIKKFFKNKGQSSNICFCESDMTQNDLQNEKFSFKKSNQANCFNWFLKFILN